jgi:hypothetical protein
VSINISKFKLSVKISNLESSSLVKKDNAACAHDAATLGPIAEAKNATYTTFLKSKTRYIHIYRTQGSLKYVWS